MEDDLNYFNTTIRGTYTQNSDCQTNNFSNIFFSNSKSNLKELIEEYTKEKKYFENQLYQIELDNFKLLQYIHFLDKRCYFINLTHSNTINFIIANYRQLKNILDKLVIIYNNNLEYIKFNKEKIYNINMTINTLKLNMSYYEIIN